MFDYHIHSSVSFDSDCPAEAMVDAAAKAGLKEICFTDHYDCHFYPDGEANLFTIEEYERAYTKLGGAVNIKFGVEFGLTSWNSSVLTELLKKRSFDFVIGSVHFADGYDPYDKEYWDKKTVDEAFTRYLEQTLACVKEHDEFDVLGHLTYVCKPDSNSSRSLLSYADYRDLTDEILKVLISKGKGLEINTSGMDKLGVFLPSVEFIMRFKELGGEIITVGSDAHDAGSVGRYINSALDTAREIFGYVCTFDDRKPVFNKL